MNSFDINNISPTLVLHLRPSRDQVAGDLLERRALHQRHCARADARVRRSRQCCRGVERIRASRSRCGIIPTGRVVSVLLGGGGPQGVSGAQCGLRYDRVGRYRKVKSKGIKGRERVVGKSGGGRVRLYTGEGPGWQMRSGSTPCRTRRAVRGSRSR
jgi:hypothetical protein